MKKLFRKSLTVIMTVVIALTAAPLNGFVGLKLTSFADIFSFKSEAATYSGTCGSNLKWSIDTSTGVLNINGTGAMRNGNYENSAPWYDYRSSIKTVYIAEGVTTINAYAFYRCANLESITIPGSVTSIGRLTFAYCTSLISVTIPDSVTSIVYDAFYESNSLTSITVDENNEYYSSDEYGVLFDKDKITLIQYPAGNARTSYTIPDSVTTIDNSAFFECASLKSLTIPDSVTTICDFALKNCTSLASITVDENNDYFSSDENGVLFNKDKTEIIQYPIGNARRSYTIPNSVTTIGSYSFYGCIGIKSIEITDSVTNICDNAFVHCESLESVIIPDSVKTIDSYAFGDCKRLEYIHIPASVNTMGADIVELTNAYICSDTNVCYARAYANAGGLEFRLCKGHSVDEIVSGTCGNNLTWTLNTTKGILDINGSGAMTDWSSYSSVPWYSYRKYIEMVNISDNVTTIGDYAFYDCYCLTNITIPNSVTTIGDYTLYYCTSLTSVTIPNSVTTIGDWAFYYCISLTGVTIPNSVTTISYKAFNYCIALTRIIVDESNQYYSSDNYGVLFNKDKTEIIKYPIGHERTDYTIPGSVTTIGDYAFFKCEILTSVIIPDSVTIIGNYAFYNCTSLTDVYYDSTEDDWNKILIGSYNESLTNATIHHHIHSYISSETTHATCTQPGVMLYICDCGNNYTETLAAKGHNYDSVVTPATCTADGYTTHTCSGCGDMYTDNIVTAPGHNYDSVITPKTCTTDGYTTHTCSACGDTYIDNQIFATGHSHESQVTKEPNCTNTGVRTYTCKCGDSYTEVINANGHTKGEWEYIGGFSGMEYAYFCTVCGKEIETRLFNFCIFFDGKTVSEIHLLNKSTAQITALILDGISKELIFTSSDSSTVSVDSNGNLVANDVGKATITVTIKDTAISDSIEVEVLPRDFTIIWNVNGKQTKQIVKEYATFTPNVKTNYQGYKFIGWDKTIPSKMPSENLEFTAQYELLVKQLKIKKPSVTTVNYGETLVLYADYGNVQLPEGYSIFWTVEGTGVNISQSEDGLTCEVTSVQKGDVTVKATVVDENGEAVLDIDGNEFSAEQQLKSNVTFWQKIVSFFKNLFGISRMILQAK